MLDSVKARLVEAPFLWRVLVPTEMVQRALLQIDMSSGFSHGLSSLFL